MKWTMLLTPFSISQLLQGAFSFDDFFQNIVTDVLPPADESKPFDGSQSFGNGSSVDSGDKGNDFLVGQPFAEAGVLLPLCRDARSELVELCYKVCSVFRISSRCV